MKALVAAGGIPNPLYKYSENQPKVLIEISSKPLLQWVLRCNQQF